MKSAFYKVTKELRYSLVWEDTHLLYNVFQIQPTDHVLVITAAGCNVLNMLLASPASITAIDLNPVQNDMLRLKAHVIAHHSYKVFANLLGLNGPALVAEAWGHVSRSFPETQKEAVESVWRKSTDGLLTGGKLERYIRGFLPSLDKPVQGYLHRLVHFGEVEEQRAFFLKHLDQDAFRLPFIDYFDKVNLSRGRDPALFAYARESGGDLFYERLKAQVSTVLVRDNFFFRFFFFGLEGLPQHLLPPAYQQENYEALRHALPKLKIENGEAMNYLLSEGGKRISKASLSNIFEYTTLGEFRAVCRQVAQRGVPLHFVFWNLLQEQGAHLHKDGWKEVSLPINNEATACFYFQNFRAVQNT